jgi:hypothetical protein
MYLMFTSVTLSQEKGTADPFEGFDAQVKTAMEDWNIPGVAISVGRLLMALR